MTVPPQPERPPVAEPDRRAAARRAVPAGRRGRPRGASGGLAGLAGRRPARGVRGVRRCPVESNQLYTTYVDLRAAQLDGRAGS